MLTDRNTLTMVSPISTSMLVPSTNMPELDSDDNDDDEEEEEEEEKEEEEEEEEEETYPAL